MLQVEDTGVGIGAEDLKRLGDPFFQAGKTYHQRRHEGTGLGLSIVRGLVALQGGELSIQSRVGAGTKVTVRIPLIVEKHPQGGGDGRNADATAASGGDRYRHQEERLARRATRNESFAVRALAIGSDMGRTSTSRRGRSADPETLREKVVDLALSSPKDTLAAFVAVAAVAIIVSNALFLRRAVIRRRCSTPRRA